ncbi:MAG: FKBP-type peptidyl-prolyl cis-trans isomerase [Vibrio sp.]
MEIVFLLILVGFFIIAIYRANHASQEAKINVEQGQHFLDNNKRHEAVHTTESGLQYQVISNSNEEKSPSKASSVTVHYEGSLIDGSVFDSSYKRGEPLTFPVNQVIQGWQEGLLIMNQGDKYRFFIPAHLGYGKRQAGSIPPGSTLIFDVELLEVKP